MITGQVGGAERFLYRDRGQTNSDIPQAWFASELISLPDFWDSTLTVDEQEKRLNAVTQRQLEFVQSLGFFDAEATLEFRIVRRPGEHRLLRFFYIVSVEDGAMADSLWRLFHSGFPGDLDFRLSMIPSDDIPDLFNPLRIPIEQLQLYEWVPRPKVLALPGDTIQPVPLVSPMEQRLDSRVQVLRLLTQYKGPLVLGFAVQPVTKSDDVDRVRQMLNVWQQRLSMIDSYLTLADTMGGMDEIQRRFGDSVVDAIGRELFDTMGNNSIWQIIYEDIRHSTIFNQFGLSPRYVLLEAQETALRLLQTQSFFRWRVHAAAQESLSDELKAAVSSDLARRNNQTLTTKYDCITVRSTTDMSYRPLEPPWNYQEIRLRSCRHFTYDSSKNYVPNGEYIDDRGAAALLSSPILPRGGIPGIQAHQANPFSGWQLYESYLNQSRLEIGEYLDSRVALLSQEGQKVVINVDDLARHALITGSTGGGKSTTCKRLLSEISKQHIPFLVIEPVKDEYSDLWFCDEFSSAGTGVPLDVYELGTSECGLWFNPFYIRKGVSLDSHISFLQSAFLAAFPMPGIFGMVFSEVVRDAYSRKAHEVKEKKGLDQLPYMGIQPVQLDLVDEDFPTLDDLISAANDLIGKGQKLDYSGDFGHNLKTAINFRLEYLKAGIVGSLLRPRELGYRVSAEKSFEAQLSDLLCKSVTLQLRQVADKGEKALIMAFMLTALYEYYEQQPASEKLAHITLIEEAHVLLENVPRNQNDESANTRGKAIELFADMLAEVRSRGEGLVIVEQLPSKLISEAIKNTNLKIMHRLTAKEDRDRAYASQQASTLSR